ncbi:bromodomain-containing protein 7-like isoform X2 [Corticium candelabrum]|uniref:bromodomain-containing protein 7-like isoform X2 n=1 Tax=Corticium candelabrum TaxID=121492 RepID=UPI002E25A1E7|nr:bromodomain-containing protein 7-like isoform X2 [Corticium candelabrum]
MGKKRKKHYRHDHSDTEVGERPLKLVLKVGNNTDGGGFTSKAIVVTQTERSVGPSLATTTSQRNVAFRSGEHFVQRQEMSSMPVLMVDDDVAKKKKKKKKKHRHSEGHAVTHQSAVLAYRPEEQQQLERLYHHPSGSDAHREMGRMQHLIGKHKHPHKHKKHHHHHHDRPNKKHRLLGPLVTTGALAGDSYGVDDYVTPMVTSGHGLKMSFKRDVSFARSFEPPVKKSVQMSAPPSPPPFFIDPSIPARVTRSQDVPGFEERNRTKDKELKKLLLRFLNALQRKDVHHMFAMPVSDKIAPGYSTVIKHPMDFQMMRLKIDRSVYRSIDEFKDDLELICTNCTTYNAPDTIYYKTAVKLLEFGLKLMKDSLSPSKRNMPPHLVAALNASQNATLGPAGLSRQPDDDLVDVDNIDDDNGVYLLSDQNRRYGIVDFMNGSMLDQEGTAETITEQTETAAKAAAAKITEQCPNSRIGFLSTDSSGATTLRVVNPDQDKENIPLNVDLRSLAGPVHNGTSKLADVKEDAKDLVIPVSYLFYGPFTSFAPLYDSSRSNMSKEDSDLLLSTYTDATGLQFAHSLQKFVETAGPAAQRVVDSILDSVTDRKHSVVTTKRKEQQKEEAKQKADVQPASESKARDESAESLTRDMISSLLLLSDEGIDVSFLDKDASETSIQSRLDENAARLINLHRAHNERLSKVYDSLESFSSRLPQPTEQEQSLALQVANELKQLSAQVCPGDIVSSEAIQHVLRPGMAASDSSSNEAVSTANASNGMSLLKQLGLDDDDGRDEVGPSDSVVIQQNELRETKVATDASDEAMDVDSDNFIASLLNEFTGNSGDL